MIRAWTDATLWVRLRRPNGQACVALDRQQVAIAPVSGFAEIRPKQRKGLEECELPAVATADNGYSIGPVALDWVRRSCSYAYVSTTDSYTYASAANTYTHASAANTYTHASAANTYTSATD